MQTAPASKKVVLFEISKPQEKDFWLNYAAGVWMLDLAGLWARVDVADATAATFKNGLPVATNITFSQVYSDSLLLTEQPDVTGSGACVQNVQNSSHYDKINNILYISLNNFECPTVHTVTIGVIISFSNHAGVWNGVFYDGRILQMPSIKKSKDPTFFGKITFDSGAVTLENTDGGLDNLSPDAMGNYAALKIAVGPTNYNDFQIIYSGYVQNVAISEQQAVVTIQDLRQQLSNPLPNAVIQNTDTTVPGYYVWAKKNLGKFIPIGYGTMFNVPGLVVNDTQAGTPDWKFIVLDTSSNPMSAISNVYYKDNNNLIHTLTLTTDYTIDLIGGSITIKNGHIPSATIEVTCDCVGLVFSATNIQAIKYYNSSYTGTDVSNAASIINEMMYVWSDLVYSGSVFNQAEWEIVRAVAPNVGLYINSATNVIDQIQLIAASARIGFIINYNGLYTARIFDTNRASTNYFKVSDCLDYYNITNSIDTSITSTVIGYAKDNMANSWKLYHDTSFQRATYLQFGKYLEQEWDTCLINETDAKAFSRDMEILLGVVQSHVTWKTKMQALDAEVMDFVDVDIFRPDNKAILGKGQVEIIDIAKDLTAFEITVIGRLIKLY